MNRVTIIASSAEQAAYFEHVAQSSSAFAWDVMDCACYASDVGVADEHGINIARGLVAVHAIDANVRHALRRVAGRVSPEFEGDETVRALRAMFPDYAASARRVPAPIRTAEYRFWNARLRPLQAAVAYECKRGPVALERGIVAADDALHGIPVRELSWGRLHIARFDRSVQTEEIALGELSLLDRVHCTHFWSGVRQAAEYVLGETLRSGARFPPLPSDVAAELRDVLQTAPEEQFPPALADALGKAREQPEALAHLNWLAGLGR